MINNQNTTKLSDIRLEFTEDFIGQLNQLPRNARIILLSWIHKNLSHTNTMPLYPAEVKVDNKIYYKFTFCNYAMFLTKLGEKHYRVEVLSVSPRKQRLRYSDGLY